MPSALHNLPQYIAIPVLIIIAGGSLSTFYSLGSRWRSSIQHFAAGLVFAAVSTSLLPEIIRTHNVPAMLVGFLFGTSLMLGMKWFTVKQGQKGFNQADRPASLVVAAGVDYLVDGMLIGIGFVLGAKQGGLLTFALSVEGLFLAVAVTSALRKSLRRSRLIVISTAFGLLLAVGAISGVVIFSKLSGFVHTAVLAFGSAALIYLVAEELLVEAHDQHAPEDPLTIALFFAGVMLLISIEMSL